jgi:hypothetical protein
MSTYFRIETEDALKYLKAREADEDLVRVDDITRSAGTGEDIGSQLRELRNKLLQLKRAFPAKLNSRDPNGGKFEAEACAIVHAGLADVDRAVLADRGFWTWLALVYLHDILEWRFGTGGKPAKFANYGVGTRTENLFFRLWLRGGYGRGSGRDAYELAKSGDQDLWRSHVLRQNYTNARPIAQSLLKLQAGRLRIDGKLAKRLASGEDPLGIRMLAKRLKRLRANVIFEYLSPTQADELVFELSSDLKRGT